MNRALFLPCLLLLLAGCATAPVKPAAGKPANSAQATRPAPALIAQPASEAGREVAMYALGLLDVGYQFGGKNPEAGLDCSGMVSFIYRNALGVDLRGSAADIAKRGRTIRRDQMQPGDLVFFNTMNKPFSHVGIYIGDDRFVHAPSTNGRIRIESLKTRYFAARFEAARTLFAG
ncbi:C40 family peptidase [Chitinimonas sp. BJYL2]|uniref:C40 family peptidase n=1 Tax=Chitinimonas sp. BJYL2 TaxID=2976696 RepID=UPI0022B33821|nr:C40 family peptidase [Chitinimonas sp. BJYL2]